MLKVGERIDVAVLQADRGDAIQGNAICRTPRCAVMLCNVMQCRAMSCTMPGHTPKTVLSLFSLCSDADACAAKRLAASSHHVSLCFMGMAKVRLLDNAPC